MWMKKQGEFVANCSLSDTTNAVNQTTDVYNIKTMGFRIRQTPLYDSKFTCFQVKYYRAVIEKWTWWVWQKFTRLKTTQNVSTVVTFLLSGVSTGGQGDVSPQISGRGTVTQKSPHFLTHNVVIASFTSWSLGLPAYACKTGSSTAIKLAPRIHQTCHFELKNLLKNFLGREYSPSQDPSVGTGHPLAMIHARPRARDDSSPHFLNRGYARVSATRILFGTRKSHNNNQHN